MMKTKCRRLLSQLAVLTIAGWPAGAVQAAEHVVTIVTDYDNLRFAFEPQTIVIAKGDTVVWRNDVNEEHNVITYPGGFPKGAEGFQSPFLYEAGETYSHTFEVAGTYQYHCLPHLLMGMRAEIVVEERTAIDGFHEPSRDQVLAYRTQLLEWFDEDDNLLQLRVADKPTR